MEALHWNKKNMQSHQPFWLDWFGLHGGRELGDPKRFYTDNPGDLLHLIKQCTSQRKPCFMSVQPYQARNVVLGLEKLYYDFDSKTDPPDLDKVWSDVFNFVERLKHELNVEPLIVATYRGYHVYAFLWQLVEIGSNQQALAKDLYTRLQNKALNGRSHKTLDPHVLGDLKRMSRVPYSLHERGVICTPLDLNRQQLQLDSLDYYREHGIRQDLFKEAVEKVQKKKTAEEILKIFESFKPKPVVKVPWKRKGLRPCFIEAIKKSEMPHLQRMALVHEAYATGMSGEEIVDLIKNQSDFDREKSSYYVKKMLEAIEREGCHPWRCETIVKYSWCLREACPIYRKRFSRR